MNEEQKARDDEAEHYRNEASNVYLANEELQEEVVKLKAELREAQAKIANLKAEAVSNHSLLNDVQAELEAELNDYKCLGAQLGKEIVELRQQAEQAAKGQEEYKRLYYLRGEALNQAFLRSRLEQAAKRQREKGDS